MEVSVLSGPVDVQSQRNTEAYINHKLVGLLAQAFLLTNYYILN